MIFEHVTGAAIRKTKVGKLLTVKYECIIISMLMDHSAN